MNAATNIARLHTEWFVDVLRITGKSPTAIARLAGVTPATLTRRVEKTPSGWIARDYPHPFRPDVMLNVSIAAGVSPPDPYFSAESRGSNKPEATPFDPATACSKLQTTIDALIDNHIDVEVWVLSGRALELAGYLPGDLVIVDRDADPKPGEIVCASRYDAAHQRDALIFRIFEPPYLVSASTDPALRQPDLIDNKMVVIKGVVINMLRPGRSAPEKSGGLEFKTAALKKTTNKKQSA